MQVILTHEQADFDAIASALGANLLYPDSSVIKPMKANRNVSLFLSHYESELMFKTIEDFQDP